MQVCILFLLNCSHCQMTYEAVSVFSRWNWSSWDVYTGPSFCYTIVFYIWHLALGVWLRVNQNPLILNQLWQLLKLLCAWEASICKCTWYLSQTVFSSSEWRHHCRHTLEINEINIKRNDYFIRYTASILKNTSRYLYIHTI